MKINFEIKEEDRTIKLINRFLNQINIPKNKNECWEWTGSHVRSTNKKIYGKDTYGQIWYIDRKIRAHRFSYAFFIGPILEGFVIMHTCDNPNCVNPNHLKMVTQSENIIDCVNKGRFRGGSSRTI